jgi:hypothetical protein
MPASDPLASVYSLLFWILLIAIGMAIFFEFRELIAGLWMNFFKAWNHPKRCRWPHPRQPHAQASRWPIPRGGRPR